MSHAHFTRDDRVRLSALLRAGHSQAACARQLAFHPSAISQELKNNGGRTHYDARGAEKRAREKRAHSRVRARILKRDKRLRRHVVRKLKKLWSPEQIAGRLKRMTGGSIIAHETIYQFVRRDRPDLRRYLRHGGRKRRTYGTYREKHAVKEAQKRRIDTRPAIVEKRARIGDWEGDTVFGKERTQRILTHLERKSGYLIADKLDVVSCDAVYEIVAERMHTRPCATITYDNGSEFALHRQMEKRIAGKIYFAYPGRPGERGANENANGLLRQFFPKRTSFATITQKDVARAATLINNRPRKRLGYLTPREVFFQKKTVAFHSRI